jgi:hypothetical protein
VTNGQHIPEEDLALYAMQALPPQESGLVEAHLATCSECRLQLSEALGDLALVGLSVDQQPMPAGARDRFLQRLRAETEASPAQSPTPFAEPTAQQPRRGSSMSVLIPWLAVAAMVAVAAYLGNQNRKLNETLNQDRNQIAQLSVTASRAQQLMDVLTAHNAQRVTLAEGKSAAAPTAHTSYLPERGELIFVADNLRQVPDSKTYELWVIPANGGAPIPAGTFRPAPNGTASVILPSLPLGVPAKAFGVTIENAEGSATPTLPIVLSGSPGA